MIIYSGDAGETIKAGAMVTMRIKGDFKAPVPQSTEMELVNVYPFDRKTLPKGHSEFIGIAESTNTNAFEDKK